MSSEGANPGYGILFAEDGEHKCDQCSAVAANKTLISPYRNWWARGCVEHPPKNQDGKP